MLIRPFEADDAEGSAALFHASVHQIGIRDYSAEQVSAWSPAVPDPRDYIRCSLDGRVFLVAVDDDGKPVGYGDLEADDHIDHLYCLPDVVGTGIGSALYDSLEGVASHRGIQVLCRGKRSSAAFVRAQGFAVEQRNDFTINGVAIHNYRMVKPLY